MATAVIYFKEILQDSQELGSNDEHMISRIYFDIEIQGRRTEGLSADVKQTIGSSYEEAPLEVGAPHNYKGPFNHSEFQDVAEQYYRAAVGRSGSAIRIEGASGHIRMSNNRFVFPARAEIEVKPGGGPW